VGRVEEEVVGQGQDLFVNRVVQQSAVALLEVGTPATADEECIAGEGPLAVRVDVRQAT
jgi:hypothetical protein